MQGNFSDTFLNGIKDRTPEILLRVLRPANKTGAICPFCGNGSGNDGDGVTVVPDNSHVIHCFKCGKSNDIFHFVMEDKHCTFPEAVKTCADSAGISIEDTPKTTKKSTSYGARKKDLSADYTKWRQDLLKNEKAMAVLKDWHLDDSDFIDKYFGFRIARIKFGDKFINAPCITIRHSNFYATCRVLPPYAEIQRFASLPRASVELFNAECLNNNEPVIVTEGAKDALSLMKAGIKNVVAVGGVSNYKTLIKALDGIENKPPFVILFDPDQPGRDNAQKLQKALAKMGILACNETLPLIENNDKTDANDWLKHNPQQLKEIIEQKISKLQETLKDWTANDNQDEHVTNETARKCPLQYNLIKMPSSLKLDFEQHITRGISKEALPETKFNSIMLVSKRFQNLDSNLEKVEISVLKPHMKKWKKFTTERRNIASRTRIVDLANEGLDVTSTRAASVVNYLDSFEVLNTEIIPTVYTVNSTGWRNDNEFVYPNSDGGDYELDDSIKPQLDKIFTTNGDKQKVINLLKKHIKKDVVYAVIGAALAAPLVKIFRCPNIAVHVHANTGSGKSTLNKLALSLFADSNATGALPTINATKAGLEYYFAGRHDLPAIIEDIDSAGDDKTKKVIAELPYQFCNNTGRLRAKKTGGNETLLDFRGSLITNGERPLTTDTSSGGGKRRLIELKGNDKIFSDEEATEIYSIIEENYGLFGRDWINYIKSHSEDIKQDFKDFSLGDGGFFKDKEFKNKIPLHISTMTAIMVACTHFFTQILGIKDKETLEIFEECTHRILKKLPNEIEIADYERAKPITREYVASNIKNFIGGASDNGFVNTPIRGVIDDESIKIYPELYKEHLKDKGFSPEKIINELADNGFIERGKDNITQVIRINKTEADNLGIKVLARVLVIPKEKFTDE